jgi:methyl coenzyme M reductase subunit C-like uncharacterized protein (methanogenesis marker protein 7)
MNHSERVKELAAIVEPLLGSVLEKHLTVKGLSLVVEVNSEAWGAQVASLEQRLLELLGVALPIPITGIQINLRRVRSDG